MRDDRSRCQAGSCWGLGSLWTSRSGPVQLTWIHTRVETAFAVGKRMIQRSINKQASSGKSRVQRAEKQEPAGPAESPGCDKGSLLPGKQSGLCSKFVCKHIVQAELKNVFI